MEQLAVDTKVVLNVDGKKTTARVSDKNGSMVELTTEGGKTLFMELRETEKGWELVPGTRMVQMDVLRR